MTSANSTVREANNGPFPTRPAEFYPPHPGLVTEIEPVPEQWQPRSNEPPPVEHRGDGYDENGEAANDWAESLSRIQQSADALATFAHRWEARDKTDAAGQTESTERAAADEGEFCFNGKGILESVVNFGGQLLREPQVFLKHYGAFARELLHIAQGASELKPERGDRRFRDAVWNDNPIYRSVLQTYLAWAREMNGLVDELGFDDEADRERTRFLLEQLTAAVSPSNSPLNPVAVKRAYQTGGLSVVAGAQNFLRDLADNHGMPRQTNTEALEVGKDLAASPGAVVFRSEVLELIQYRCTTNEVHRRPILIVPPQINKFYIFDLTPKNSVAQHLLQNGHQVFMVSWKNPSRAQRHWSLDTYVQHLDRAIAAMTDICDCREFNLASGCAGGITATALQAYYHQINKTADAVDGELNKSGSVKPRVVAHSLLVTALSAREHPTLDLFVNRNAVKLALRRAEKRGVMDGRELAHVFAWLRPVDLVWNFWVNNFLLGKEPPTMDVLFWDNDSTRLPAALHKDFMKIFVEDRYARPNSMTVGGQPLDLTQLDSDFYLVGGDEDYLMPWKNCYRNRRLLPNARCEFVLSDSGHIQSVLRPPGIGNTRYYTNSDYTEDPDQWLANAEKHSGSWWSHWADWLGSRSGKRHAPPTQLGNENYPPLCASPGTYVLER